MQTCFRLPVNPTVTHMEGLVLGSEDAGSINPFIVALISQPQSISLLETGYGSEVIGWKSAKSINTTRRALCVVRKTQNPDQVLYTERQQNRQLLWDKLQWESRAVRVSVRVSFLFCFGLVWFFFMSKSIKVSSCNHWCQCLKVLLVLLCGAQGADLMSCISAPWTDPHPSSPHPFPSASPCVGAERGSERATLADWEQSHTLAGLL